MLNEDVILYFKNPEHTKVIREIEEFVPSFKYNIIDYAEMRQFEYGTLKLKTCKIKLLHDCGINENCPWCDCPKILTVVEILEDKNLVVVWKECSNCGCRGPRLNLKHSYYLEVVDEVEGIMHERWRRRKSTD